MQTKTFTVYSQENKVVQDAYSMLTSNIHLGSENKTIKTLVITSFEPRNGKTSLAISLAITMSSWGKKILLIDADMRKPANTKHLSGEAVWGLSDYLQGLVKIEDALCKTNFENLTYLSCGKYSSDPMGLLCAEGLDNFLSNIQKEYDFIILDTPPLSSVSDASLLAAKADATMLVAEMGKTNLVNLKRTKEQLEKANANIIGVVLNKVKKKDYKKYFESYNYFLSANRPVKKNSEKSEIPISIQIINP